jgi:GAF domain-containing protein
MDVTDNQMMRLQDLQQFLASGSLEDSLQQQAQQTARLVGAANCTIMLLNSGSGQDLRMTVCARHGTLPAAALHAAVGKGEGICGQVLASGRALLVPDIRRSPFAHLARRPEDQGGSLMSAPIWIDGKIVGVANLSGPLHGPAFVAADLHLLEVVALFIGKSIQVIQLQHLLDSRFAQLALLQEVQERVGSSVRTAYRHPGDAAKILARSFFREMTKAGFESGQIVTAATELIEQLNHKLHRNNHGH